MIMFISKIRRRLNDISISKKLYFTIGFTSLLIIVELSTLWFSITTLSAVRSYVSGEGLWSKAQKDAVLKLKEYAYSHNEQDYLEYKEHLKVPLGDKQARESIQQDNPNLEAAKQGFLQGRNHPEDIEGMITLSLRFHEIHHLNIAFTAWANAEPTLERLMEIAEQLHLEIRSDADIDQISTLLKEIDLLNAELTKLEDNFSLALGEGARWLEGLVLQLVLALSLTIGMTSIAIAISINRNLKKGLDAIAEGAELIKKGKLKSRVRVYSKDEIGALAIAFNEMANTLDKKIEQLKLTEQHLLNEKERAEQSDIAKQHFLINISHEIRTPMNAILGFARYLEESLKEKDQQESIKMIINSGDHLLMTFNDILDFTRIGTGKINFIVLPFNLNEVVESIFMLTDPNARLKKIELSYNVDDNIPNLLYGDSVRLTQILLNLTSNAIKFTEQGGVAISACKIDEDHNQVVIQFMIKDTGIGIAPESTKKIFDVFEQGTSGLSRKFSGTGIGLSIVKQLLTLQGGTIWVDSIVEKGSEFYFTLPFSKHTLPEQFERTEVKVYPSGDSIKEGSGIRVLIVEDNPINQLLVLKLLQKHGYDTTVAENGRIALHKYNKTDFDIILMDLQMPEMDGYEATIAIRQMNSGKKQVPIVAMTAHTIKGEYEKCMGVGMNDYISKPFRATELYEKIQKLVNKKEQVRVR